MQTIDTDVSYMLGRHLDQVLDIEQDSFSHPWNRRTFVEASRSKHSRAYVATREGRVLGYLLELVHRTGNQVDRLAVHPDFRREGVASLLVSYVQTKAYLMGRPVTTQVNESNLSAQLFYRHAGFLAVKVLRGFFAELGEDGYLFEWKKDEATVQYPD